MNAFLFPGQGSQSVGMGKFLYDNFQNAKTIFEEASDAISIDLKKLCFDSPEADLALTHNTQPALLCVSTATAKVLKNDLGVKPSYTAGHSIGEYSSLVLAGVINFSTAMKAVRLRGQAMQEAVPVGQGGMTAVMGLTEEQVEFLCKWVEKESGLTPLSPANFNCDGQVVISGNIKALNWLKDNFKPEVFANPESLKRVKFIPLQVSAPFHCSMMLPAQRKMDEFFSSVNFNKPEVKVIQNVNAKIVENPIEIKTNIIEQVSGSVKWTQSMRTLKSENISQCFEVGNGSVLKGLLKKIDGEFFKVYNTNSVDDLKIIESLGK